MRTVVTNSSTSEIHPDIKNSAEHLRSAMTTVFGYYGRNHLSGHAELRCRGASCARASLFDEARMPKLLANILFRWDDGNVSRSR
jgi:hypothetical protein